MKSDFEYRFLSRVIKPFQFHEFWEVLGAKPARLWSRVAVDVVTFTSYIMHKIRAARP